MPPRAGKGPLGDCQAVKSGTSSTVTMAGKPGIPTLHAECGTAWFALLFWLVGWLFLFVIVGMANIHP